MKPTEKQINFIKQIASVLDVDNPNCETKEEAKMWISNHIDEYKKQSATHFYDWDNEILNG